MPAALILLVLVLLLVAAGAGEAWLLRRRLHRIPIRIHVNGTRGKSSVVRLIAAALREANLRTCAKTTGTLARMILPDGRELPIYRPAGPNVIEQKRIAAMASAYGAEALVIECMALQPELQSLSELRLVRSTHGVITNARPDHLDVMGPGPEHVAQALAGSIPRQGKLFTAEREHLAVLAAAAADRGTELIAVTAEDIAAVSADELAGFSYTEHPDNVALALAVTTSLEIPRAVALRGMHRAQPDPGALTEHSLDFFGRRLCFLNGFAANDPVSTRQLWEYALRRNPEADKRIAIFNCRADRPERSRELGHSFPTWTAADHVVLMGTATHVFVRAAAAAGLDPTRLVLVEGERVDAIFERVISLTGRSAVVMGMGNIGGDGLELVRYFQNRAHPSPGDP